MTTVNELKEKTDSKIEEFFELLTSENLLIKNSRVVDESFVQSFLRMWRMQNSIILRKNIFEDKEKFKEFLKVNKNFGITEDSFMFDFQVSSVHFLLSCQELINKFLVEILDTNILHINEDRPMLGTTIRKLGEYSDSNNQHVFSEDGLRELFHVTMRNSIGHDSWWIDENRNIHMGNEEPYTFEEFNGEILATSLLENAISVSYMKRFFPDKLDETIREINPS